MKEKTNQVFKTRQQIAEEYGICIKTFCKKLKENGIVLNKGLISPNDQVEIYKKIGFPKNTNKY